MVWQPPLKIFTTFTLRWFICCEFRKWSDANNGLKSNRWFPFSLLWFRRMLIVPSPRPNLVFFQFSGSLRSEYHHYYYWIIVSSTNPSEFAHATGSMHLSILRWATVSLHQLFDTISNLSVCDATSEARKRYNVSFEIRSFLASQSSLICGIVLRVAKFVSFRYRDWQCQSDRKTIGLVSILRSVICPHSIPFAWPPTETAVRFCFLTHLLP
jgi:hypothetical protein